MFGGGSFIEGGCSGACGMLRAGGLDWGFGRGWAGAESERKVK
jgi:hypothetical protein